MKNVTDEQLNDMSQYCSEYHEENLYQEYFSEIFEQLNINQPTNWRQSLDLYHSLCQVAEDEGTY